MSNDTLLREVDEELRRDRLRKLWRQGAPFIIGAAVAVVLLVAGYEGYNWWQESTSSRSSDQFYDAVRVADGLDGEAAKTALDKVIAESSGAYPMLARFRQAALLAQTTKTDEAIAAYDALSTSLSDTRLRELALILAANLLIDKGDVAAVEQRLAGTLASDSPMRNAAREALGLTQYKAGKLDDAMKTFQSIVDDPLAQSDLIGRVQIYMQQLLAEGAAPIVSEAPSEEAPADVSAAPAGEVDASTELDVTPPSSAEVSSSAP
jgi:hypothetical protein